MFEFSIYLLVRPFSARVAQSVLQYHKDPIVGIKRRRCMAKKATRTTNQWHQMKGNHAKMQKKTSSLAFFFVFLCLKIIEVEYSRTSRKQPPKMQRLSGRLREVVAHKNRTTGALFQEEVRAHHFMGDNQLHAISPCVVPCCYYSSSCNLSSIAHTANI